MKWVLLRAAGLAACLMMLAGSVTAQTVVRIYMGEGAMEEKMAGRMTELLDGAFPQAEFELIDREEGSLRDLVLSDCAPQLAVCSPREAAVWAREGLVLPLQMLIDDQAEIARELISVCVREEKLFMLPLLARHRQMAVNVKEFERHMLGYMLDEIAHPVWYPTEFQQILEEFAIADRPALELWRAKTEDAAPMEAMIQAIYCGRLLGEDGTTCRADDRGVFSGMRWLHDLIGGELIGCADTRQEALERFLAGETAIFADWTKELQDTCARQMKEAGMIIKTRPYPSSSGLPVRSYELTGVSVFDSGDAEINALALQAAVFLHEDAQVRQLLDGRGIFEDDSIWLWDLSASDRGATLRSLLCDAVGRVLAGEEDVVQALEMVKAGMDMAQ